MTAVYLVTCARLPDGEPGGKALVEGFAERGVDARWAIWDDPGVDWSAADLVLVRSPWDYAERREEFLHWASTVPRLLHPASVLSWNTDKSYLIDLRDADVPIVPTVIAATTTELAAAVADVETAVVKPLVGAGGRGVALVDRLEEGGAGEDDRPLPPGPWAVQPLVESVHTEGEHSVFVFDGEPVTQMRKVPAAGEIRVHEEFGGTSRPVDLDPAAADVARFAVRAAQGLVGTMLTYARVDLLRIDGDLVVGELEVAEPGLYLDVLPVNAEHYVAAALEGMG